MSSPSTPQPTPAAPDDNNNNGDSHLGPIPSDRRESDDSDDGASSDESEPVETLIAGRSRRATAGNRMSHLIGQEEEAGGGEDDDVALLFAEAGGEDVDFEDPDAQQQSGEGEDLEDDDDDDSSSSEEEKGPEDGDGELEGERQLQKEERAAKKAEKRKALAKPLAVRKRVKIDDSVAMKDGSEDGANARPRKKSERISWLPSVDDAPTRTSSRTLSVQNKVRTMASMKESDAKRAQTIKNMEVASQKKKQDRAKQMTQEERLEEASRVEEINTKSLTRWEEMEKERLEKQRAKIAALQNRTLEGPVIRWYTGPAEKVGGKVTMLGSQSVVKEIITLQHDVDAPKVRKYQRKNKKLKEEPPAESVDDPGGNVPAPGSTAERVSPAAQEQPAPSVDAKIPQDSPTKPHEEKDPATKSDEPPAEVPSPRDENQATDMNREESKLESTHQDATQEQQDQPRDVSVPDLMDVDASNREDANQSELPPQTEQTHETEPKDPSGEPEQETSPTENLDPPTIGANDGDTSKMEIDSGAGFTPQAGPPEVEPISPPADNLEAVTAPATNQLEGTDTAPETPIEPSIVQTPGVPATLPAAPTPTSPRAHQDPATHPLPVPQNGAALSDEAPPAPPPPEPIKTSQQTVTLLEFSENALNSLDASRRILFSAAPSLDPSAPPPLPLDAFIRPPKPLPQTCVITGAPARYRDPATGLPYADRMAYAMIKRVLRGECRWSNLLGAWVGADVEQIEGVEKDVTNGQDVALVGIGGTRAARGVPLGFLDPASVLPPPPPPPPPSASADTAVVDGEKSGGETAAAAASQGAEVKVEGGNAGAANTTPPAAAATATV